MRDWNLKNKDKLDGDKTNDDLEKERTLIVAGVHLNNQVANNQAGQIDKDDELKRFYNALASAIVQYKVRVINGDFNMDTIRAVTELRFRGLCVNVPYWRPWLKSDGESSEQDESLGDPQKQLDSVLIMVVDPADGIRLPFDVSVFGMRPPSVVAECSVVVD